MISENDMRNILRHRCNESGSVTEFARQNGLNQSFVNKVVTGTCRFPPGVAKILGYAKKVHFVPCNPEKEGA